MELSGLGTTTTHADVEAQLLRGKRVLVAEDDEVARAVMASVLRRLGAEVIESADGGRMLVAIASQYKDGRSPSDIDLIVIDVHMPVVGGLEVFQGLRAAGWRTPVVVVTGYETPAVRDATERLDAVVLSKPLDLERFENIVIGLVAARGTRAATRPSARRTR